MSQPSWQSWEDKDRSSDHGVPDGWRGGDVTRPGPDPTPPAFPYGAGAPGARQWPGSPPVMHHATAAMLASHADRDRAVDVLRAGYGEGRLEKEEFDRRVERAYAARTVGELALLVGDLPGGPVPMPATAVPRTFLPAPRPRTNGKAVGAGVCGMLCLVTFGFTGIPALILGYAARSEMDRTGESGDGLALTGLVLGWLSVAGWTVFMALLILLGLSTE